MVRSPLLQLLYLKRPRANFKRLPEQWLPVPLYFILMGKKEVGALIKIWLCKIKYELLESGLKSKIG